ncbi:MAG: fatty acid desaturase [Mojavia pulchra JT2-VF2]|jgi:fatty acid desaturase|uniref:Fatty acid desaturase n=1 Tax=Mojavia pulchra JT2-VF2 TaxID=287848 RepID=A0A951PXY5_9NOST|nr:fatty acid desaturase [Mojavia pulchra JT2-VF2]
MAQIKPIDFVERNNMRTFLALLKDWISIFVIAALSIWANNIFVYLIAVWLIGVFQFALGEAFVHEAVHHNLFTEKSWHEKLEFIYSYPFLRTLSSYQAHHFPHHKYLLAKGDYIPEDYDFLGLNKPNKNVFMILFVKPFLGFSVYYFFLEAILYPLIQDSFKFSSLLKGIKSNYKLYLFWLIVILTFSFSGHLDILLLYWFVPLSWSFSFLSLLSEVQEHFNTFSGARSNVNPVINFFFHNAGYHYVHHLCPTIPWYKLPEAHQALCADNPDISHSILDTYRQCIRNNQNENLPQITALLNM